ncbi:hypothetical protein AVEN_195130-1 [Araneus ventricosus]|uniref:Uncharacterized protein n=1 Tax=Araneus ventricosus TaxID=182803 RepID=A0A4Y2BJA9_ARAVE|nr:hypothetical protein AVEN_195130-1 [Araneus ventricosus]
MGLVLGPSLFLSDSKKTGLKTEEFPLYITGSYRTTPTAALQTITGIMPLHLKAQQEAIYINFTCLRKEIEFDLKVSPISQRIMKEKSRA